MLIFCIFQSSIIWKESGLSALMDILILIYLLSILAINQPSDFFLAPSGAQEVAMSVCHLAKLSRALNLCLYGLNIQAGPFVLS